MKKKFVPPEPLVENGIHTIRFLAQEDNFRYHAVRLKCGDEIGIQGIQAKGILKIYESLIEENKKTMEDMELLQLLFLYEKAIQDKVLTPPTLRLMAGDFDLHDMKWVSKRDYPPKS